MICRMPKIPGWLPMPSTSASAKTSTPTNPTAATIRPMVLDDICASPDGMTNDPTRRLYHRYRYLLLAGAATIGASPRALARMFRAAIASAAPAKPQDTHRKRDREGRFSLEIGRAH